MPNKNQHGQPKAERLPEDPLISNTRIMSMMATQLRVKLGNNQQQDVAGVLNIVEKLYALVLEQERIYIERKQAGQLQDYEE